MVHRCPVSCIVPPHILHKLLESKDRKLRELALSTLLASTRIRAQRNVLSLLPVGTTAGEKRCTIYDAKNFEPYPPQGCSYVARGINRSRTLPLMKPMTDWGLRMIFIKKRLHETPLMATV